MTQLLVDIQSLIASVENKESVLTNVKGELHEKNIESINVKDELERALSRERIANSEAAKSKVMCNNMFRQITGLISQQLESEAELRALRVATGNVPFAFHE